MIYESNIGKYVTDWSRDGKYLSLSVEGGTTKWDMWILPLEGERKPVKFLQTDFNEWVGIFSPDGRWIAYQSDESGRYEVYVRPFSGEGGKWQISTGGGDKPAWRGDGKELYFTSANRKLMAVGVQATGSRFEVGIPKPLFDLDASGTSVVLDVTPDGERFLVEVDNTGHVVAPVTLVLNWPTHLAK